MGKSLSLKGLGWGLFGEELGDLGNLGKFALRALAVAEERRRRISDEEWELFHQRYCEKYKIRPSRELIRKEFASSGLFDLRDERYGFRHPASYYYFVAHYLRDNLSQSNVKESVIALLSQLHKEEYASIWLFLTHLSKDPFLLESVISHAKRIYCDWAPARFETDIHFLQSLADSAEKIVLRDTDFEEAKESRLRTLDSLPEIASENGGVDLADDEAKDDEPNEALEMLVKINLALRTLEILGQLVKNFPGSLPGSDKLALVEECYALGLRTITMLFNLFQNDVEAFVDCVYERLLERNPDIKDKNELKLKVRKSMFWIIEGATFGMIKRISQAVGHSQLGETYREVVSKNESNAVALVDIAVRLENFGFPEENVKVLAQKFRKSIFSDRLLKQLVVEHFYLFPTRESTKQKVCEILQIEIKKLRQLDVQSESEKKTSRSALED